MGSLAVGFRQQDQQFSPIVPIGLQAESAKLSQLVGRPLDLRRESELCKAESDRLSPP